MPNNYPPLATLLSGLRGGDIGMPGSEVYPPAPQGNQPYNPVGSYAGLWANRFAHPGRIAASSMPMTTEQMLPAAQDIMKLFRLGGMPR